MISGVRQRAKKDFAQHASQGGVELDPLPLEVDNHADTTCAGRNCRVEFYTGEVCSVSPFLDDYDDVEEVRICTALTAVTLESTGRTIVLRLGQCLDFTDKLNKTLLNPNQLREYNVAMCDDPVDPYRELGIELQDGTHVAFEMNGTICSAMTRYPTDEELATCDIYTISDIDTWDPTNVTFERVRGAISHNVRVSSVAIRDNDSCGIKEDCHKETQPDDLLVLLDNIRISSAVSKDRRHHDIDAESLADKWECSIETARKTLDATTQLNVRSAIAPLTRRYRTDLLSQRLRRLDCRFYTDTMFPKVKSLTGRTCAQIYYSNEGYVMVYPMSMKSEVGDTLHDFVTDVGVPNTLVFDGAAEQVGPGTHFDEIRRHYRINDQRTEPYSPWQNRAESGIRILKSKWRRLMVKRGVPIRLWDFAFVWICQIYSRMATKSGRSGMEIITGDTPDISEWIDFTFYDWVWFWHPPDGSENPRIGRWLGVSHRVGSALCYWVLTSTGRVVARTTVQHITEEDMSRDDVKVKMDAFRDSISRFLSDTLNTSDLDGQLTFLNDDEEEDEEDYVSDIQDPEQPDIDDVVDNSDVERLADTYHAYVGAEVCVPDAAGVRRMAKVIKQVSRGDENPTNNPLLDHSVLEVEFHDGTVDRLQANVVAENMMSQVDTNGHHFQTMREIVEHEKDGTAITRDNGFIQSKSGNLHPKKTTRGWRLLVEWLDGSSSWVDLKKLKESNPIEVAEYALANGIAEEPAFRWWVPSVIKKKDRLIGKVKSKYWRTTHKFGIRIPKTVEEAYRLDQETGTDYWTKAINKEMSKVRVAFEKSLIPVDEMRTGKARPGYQEIKCHWVFDIKMDEHFTRKARLVAGGHKTEEPTALTYSSVVSRESVRIAFLLAALNDLKVMTADVGNAYLNAPCREKIWTVAGIEFGSDAGTVMFIVRALYGLKSSGASWASTLASTLSDMGYKATEADRNVWIKKGCKPDGFRYYQLILVYVDDILHISHSPMDVITQLRSAYTLKEESVGTPKRYLGANIERVQTSDGRIIWSMTSEDYVRAAIENVEGMLRSDGSPPLKVYGDCKRPYPKDYRPELDITDELGADGIQRFQELIGMLRWAIELGRIDIITEVSNLSQYLCSPRVGHLDAAYRIFRYLQRNMSKNVGRLGFDPFIPPVDESIFNESPDVTDHWKEFYPDAEYQFPKNMPEPLGNPVEVAVYVDANHAGNLANRRSHSGILIYINNAPIQWFSKRQNTVESSSFGSEFVALRIAVDLIEALLYKLRMFGIPIDNKVDVYCDNKSVVTNASVPSSVLHKRHNAICYHRVREAQAAGMIRVGWIPGNHNLADLFTKTTMPGNVKNDIVSTILMNDAAVLEDEG